MDDGVGILERESSIEKEPRTLNIGQIDFAREAALYVVNTRSIEEAMSIFTQGLEPVVRCAEVISESGLKDAGGNHVKETALWMNDESNRRIIRDIVSAPF